MNIVWYRLKYQLLHRAKALAAGGVGAVVAAAAAWGVELTDWQAGVIVAVLSVLAVHQVPNGEKP